MLLAQSSASPPLTANDGMVQADDLLLEGDDGCPQMVNEMLLEPLRVLVKLLLYHLLPSTKRAQLLMCWHDLMEVLKKHHLMYPPQGQRDLWVGTGGWGWLDHGKHGLELIQDHRQHNVQGACCGITFPPSDQKHVPVVGGKDWRSL